MISLPKSICEGSISSYISDFYPNEIKDTNIELNFNKVDKLIGLKENVIVGRLVPAGTGSIKNLWNRKAKEDDDKFLSEQEKLEPTETQVNQ